MASTVSTAFLVSAKISAPTTADSARFEPTERSMPRVRITSNCPMARMAMAELCASTLPRLPAVKNTGERFDRIRMISSRISSGPSRSSASTTCTTRSREGLPAAGPDA